MAWARRALVDMVQCLDIAGIIQVFDLEQFFDL
jgi:hypothetical protein